ncbi:molybdopterin-guanine dinucleotide biosynthesis protein MobC [Enterobacter hormaechei]|uniref:molybdopterin-guanine dinucleotide biosynthesis protein MobC n=1 Tax=Enterobacter hormaechei TaxID=158836 RepID=UPI000BB7AAE7|nr:molybdopterin-guanine dinucleotide biosynthesis protein MobC [Enterobacter hormaechei]
MSKKAFYSDEDIELAKVTLAGLPDLTPQRKSQQEFLDEIRDDLLALVKTKGYTVSDIKETLKTTGYEISERALREIVRDADKNKPARKNRRSTAENSSSPTK